MNKGFRIRYSDKKLLCNFHLRNSAFIILTVMLLFYFKDIIKFNWAELSLQNLTDCFNDININYLIISLSVATSVCILYAVLFNTLCKKKRRQLRHRQALARMVIENGWYEYETIPRDKSFSNLSVKTKRVVTWFPKLYYKFKDSRIYILIEVTMGRAQDHYLSLEKKIETGLFCEFVEFTAKEPYYQYIFYYDIAHTRININDLCVSNGGIELMKGFTWKFDKLPHALIVGGTGSGKTYFLLVLIEALVTSGAVVSILDPKNADLSDLAQILPNVYHLKDDIVNCIDNFTNEMLERSEKMKHMPNYKTGGNYASLGLEPHFIVFDEYVAFMEMLGYKQTEPIMSNLKKIAMLGRQVGFFLILACQRPDAKYLTDGVRDQFHFRVALGRNSSQGYRMMFNDTDKTFLTMPCGRGYADMGTNIVSEFYVPFVPDGYDFLKEIGKSTFKSYQPGVAEADITGEIEY